MTMAVEIVPLRPLDTIEARRIELQRELDAKKTPAERNKLGQFATPSALATEMLEYAKGILGSEARVRFMEPGFGTGAFYSALLRTFPSASIESAVGYEIDPHYGDPAIELWRGTPLKLIMADFTQASPPPLHERANLLICNPPYVRHHHINQCDKARLQDLVQRKLGIRPSGLSGLYCYFMLLAHDFMADDGLAGWLVPSEFMDVNYGTAVKNYLLNKVTLLHIHRFDASDVQFGDAFVSSAIVWFRKTPPPSEHTVTFTFGGTLRNPKTKSLVPVRTLKDTTKWTEVRLSYKTGSNQHPKLSLLFVIKRGLATGSNGFFILTPEKVREHEIPPEFLTPILPSPRHLTVDEVHSDDQGNPIIDRPLFLLTCDCSEEEVQVQYPGLWRYLERGVQAGVHKGYLCSRRSPWYLQERRPAAPILCTYMGRRNKTGRTFRFILNHSRATATNTYLMLYPRPILARAISKDPGLVRVIWQVLKNTSPEAMVNEGRVYGGGLHKLEPKELGNIRIDISSLERWLSIQELLGRIE